MTQSVLNINITEWWFVVAIAAAFAWFVMRRGITVGLFMLGGTVAGMALADTLARLIKPWVNFSYQTILAMVSQHAFSPEDLFKAALKQPQLITQDSHLVLLGSVLFVLIIVLAYLIGKRRKTKPPRHMTRALAALIGAVNGYLIAFFLFPRHITQQETVITVPNVDIKYLLQVQLGLPILVAVVVVITVGVLGAREGKAKGK
jgi:hypothetical protein